MKEQIQIIDAGDYWVLPIERSKVARCFVDYALGLMFDAGGRGITIRIEGRFLLRMGEKELLLTPGENPAGLGPALALFQEEVVCARAQKDGLLCVAFLARHSRNQNCP